MLVVVLGVAYLIFFNPKAVKYMLQFFVLNLVISTVYLLGVGLLLFLVVPQNQYSISFATVYISLDYFLHTTVDASIWGNYLKIVLVFWLIPFLAKLTLAPFSV